MTPYDIGKNLAIKLAYGEDPAASFGTLLGAGAGAAGGGIAGKELADHINDISRKRVLGIPIPFTGTDISPVMGEAAGALGGAALGSAVGNSYARMHSPQQLSPAMMHYFLNKGNPQAGG